LTTGLQSPYGCLYLFLPLKKASTSGGNSGSFGVVAVVVVSVSSSFFTSSDCLSDMSNFI